MPSALATTRLFASGQIFRFNQAEHWHSTIKSLVGGLLEDLRADVRSAVFMSADGSIFADGYGEGTHRFILQLYWESGPSARTDSALMQTFVPETFFIHQSGYSRRSNCHDG